MTTENTIRNLGVRMMRMELERSGTVSVQALDDLLSPHLRISAEGETYTVDSNGKPDGQSLSKLIENAKVARPDLFKSATPSSGRKATGNPFAPQSWNVTRQMRLIQDDPDEAEKLAEEAGQTPIWRR